MSLRSAIFRVRVLTKVFRLLRSYAMERGEHMRYVVFENDNEENQNQPKKDLMFDKDEFKNLHK